MKNKPTDQPVLVVVSVKVYQLLIMAYPASFRATYGSQMLQVFRDGCLRAYRQRGLRGMPGLWAATLFDFIRSLIMERLQMEVGMANPKFIHFSGWAFSVGSVALLPWLINVMLVLTPYSPILNGWHVMDMVGSFGLLYSCILLPIGMLGLWTRYGGQIGLLGRGALVFGILGGVELITMIIYSMIHTVAPTDQMIMLFISGILLLFLGLLVFGAIIWIHKPFPKGNSLLLTSGLALPFFLKVYGFLTKNRFLVESPLFLLPAIIGLIVMTTAMIRFGQIIQSDETLLTENV